MTAGRIALITGAGSGIGEACALALAQAGWSLVLAGRRAEPLERVAESVRTAGGEALPTPTDVADPIAVDRLFGAIRERFGRLDLLFNNAGIGAPPVPLEDLPLEAWRRTVEVNLTGAYLCARAFAPAMIERRHGRIINMGSVLSGRGMALRTAYAASKAGLANLGASLCFELGPHGITVNTIGATVIVTDLNRDLIRTQPALYDQVLRRTALGRLGEIEDVTGALVFLASDAARFITGQTLYVDGGYTAG